MNHFEALNFILSHTCPRDVEKLEDGRELDIFVLDLHCAEARIAAELTSTVGSIQYKIHSVKLVDASGRDHEPDDHEPDNERGVWCCDQHRYEYYNRVEEKH